MQPREIKVLNEQNPSQKEKSALKEKNEGWYFNNSGIWTNATEIY